MAGERAGAPRKGMPGEAPLTPQTEGAAFQWETLSLLSIFKIISNHLKTVQSQLSRCSSSSKLRRRKISICN